MQQQVLANVEASGWTDKLPIALDNAAEALSKLGEIDKARELLQRAKTHLPAGDKPARAINALGLSNVHAAHGLPDRGQLIAHRALGDHLAETDPQRATAHYRNACQLARRLQEQLPRG